MCNLVPAPLDGPDRRRVDFSPRAGWELVFVSVCPSKERSGFSGTGFGMPARYGRSGNSQVAGSSLDLVAICSLSKIGVKQVDINAVVYSFS